MSVPFLELARETAAAPEIAEAVARVVSSGWYVLGPEVEAFEREYAEYCGAAHCVGVGNGLDALALALRAWGIGPGDDVLVPASTFIATWLAVTAVGATVVPVDPPAGSALVDAESFVAARTPRTRAAIPVHLSGACTDADALRNAFGDDVFVLEDAAQAHGARRAGRRAGALGHAAAFSFYPAKNLGCVGDGGAVVTDDAALAARLRSLRNYGSVVKYSHLEGGANSRLDELQAAVLRARLPRLDERNALRRSIARTYNRALAGLGLELPKVTDDDVVYVYMLRCPAGGVGRNALREALGRRGIGTQVFYPEPPHRSGAYAALGLGPFPQTDLLAAGTLALPVGPYLEPFEVDEVIDAVRDAVAELGADLHRP